MIVTNVKKSLTGHQLARELRLNQKTAWYMQTRIRAEMLGKNDLILKGLVDADETYVGGKPRKQRRPRFSDWLSAAGR